MKLYHVRFDLSNKSTKFIPTVPLYPMRGEDKETPRACFATSIMGAISACANGRKKLELAEEIQSGLFYVLETDTSNFKESELLHGEDLMKYGVADCMETGEYWILASFNSSIKAVSADDFHFVEDTLTELYLQSDNLLLDTLNASIFKSFKVKMRNLNIGCKYSGEFVEICNQEDNHIALMVLADCISSDPTFKSDVRRLGLIYSDWSQLRELTDGLKEGLDTSVYSDPRFSSKQMREIRIGLEQGLSAEKYAHTFIDFQSMLYMRKALLNNLSIDHLIREGISYPEVQQYLESRV